MPTRSGGTPERFLFALFFGLFFGRALCEKFAVPLGVLDPKQYKLLLLSHYLVDFNLRFLRIFDSLARLGAPKVDTPRLGQ